MDRPQIIVASTTVIATISKRLFGTSSRVPLGTLRTETCEQTVSNCDKGSAGPHLLRAARMHRGGKVDTAAVRKHF